MEINDTAKQQILHIVEECKSIKPSVIIRCTAFNHEKYIKDALEGFIMQKTEFPFIAIIHDDVSTDKTAKIIKEYAEKYPTIIYPIFEKENQFQHRGAITRIFNKAFEKIKPKYIAMCEGDDYWTDPLKLQKQVNFLDANPEYTLVFHNVKQKFENTGQFKDWINIENREYSAKEIIETWTIPTCSALMKSEMIDFKPSNPNFKYGDNITWLTCAMHGKIYGMSNIMAIYRKYGNSFTSRHDFYETIRLNYFQYKGIYQSFSRYKQFIDFKEFVLTNILKFNLICKLHYSKQKFNESIDFLMRNEWQYLIKSKKFYLVLFSTMKWRLKKILKNIAVR